MDVHLAAFSVSPPDRRNAIGIHVTTAEYESRQVQTALWPWLLVTCGGSGVGSLKSFLRAGGWRGAVSQGFSRGFFRGILARCINLTWSCETGTRPSSARMSEQPKSGTVQLLEEKPKTVGDIITILWPMQFLFRPQDSLYIWAPRHLSGYKQHMLRFWLLRRYLKQQRVPRDLCFRAPRLPCNFSRRVVGNLKWFNS